MSVHFDGCTLAHMPGRKEVRKLLVFVVLCQLNTQPPFHSRQLSTQHYIQHMMQDALHGQILLQRTHSILHQGQEWCRGALLQV